MMRKITAIVSNNSRFRYHEKVEVGRHSIVDDFGYFSTTLRVGAYCHIASHAHISGGPERTVTLGDFSALSARTSIICSSNNYESSLLGYHDTPDQYLGGDVSFGEMSGCGVGCTILWDNHIPEGTALLAGSFVPPSFKLEPWTLYGIDYENPYTLATIGDIGYRLRFRDRILKQREKVENDS